VSTVSPNASPTALLAGNFSTLTRLVGLFRREFTERLADEPWAVESGARPPTYGVLSVVGHLGPVSQREVSDIIGLHASDLVEVVDLVERQGWVARRRDPADRRRYQLTLTDEGRAILDRYDALAAETEAAVLEPLTETERRRLMDLVSKVVSSHLERT
jgi:MarR family transcriptional regulator, lower aerobic nicotinate degradation pathway regulator